jgi:sec-independent protein translocase protein TatC
MTNPNEMPDQEGLVKPFLDHLEDLRRTLLWCLAALVVGIIIAIPIAPEILGILKRPIAETGRNPEEFLKIIDVMGGMAVAIRVVLWSGLLISLPLMVCFIGSFVFPGLRAQEKRTTFGAGVLAVILFLTGVVLAFSIIPAALKVMFKVSTWMNAEPDWVRLPDYVSFVLKLLIAFGLMFELPIVVLALGAMGLVSSAQLREYRRYVIVGLFIAAMLLTPPDPLTQVLMAAPMTLLYEACIWILWLHEKRSRAPTG